ncbi:YqkE family protein [Neobacillus sp. SM06]|uniref:YqkE family protein n=1 Tax=Neobacillus sp. SM06 TaxID=3422492 RepID=UPI003D29977A
MKKHQRQKPKKDDAAVTLGDRMNQELVKLLKEKQRELKAAEENRMEEEQRKREERRLKEKKKSFEELLQESDMNWKDFK